MLVESEVLRGGVNLHLILGLRLVLHGVKYDVRVMLDRVKCVGVAWD